MQTFLPYADFNESATVLDRARLGKQRVENYQILQAISKRSSDLSGGWINHPATLMWDDHLYVFIEYHTAITEEWLRRGYKDTTYEKFMGLADYLDKHFVFETSSPDLIGWEPFHASHRSNLLRKMPEHYSQFGWTEPNNLEYIWKK